MESEVGDSQAQQQGTFNGQAQGIPPLPPIEQYSGSTGPPQQEEFALPMHMVPPSLQPREDKQQSVGESLAEIFEVGRNTIYPLTVH
jgi:hypothetical protein